MGDYKTMGVDSQAIIFSSHCGRDAGPNEWNRQKPRKAWVESRYCWFCELWLRSVKVREKLVAGVVPKLSAVTTLSILFPPSLTTKWSLPETDWVALPWMKIAPLHVPPLYSVNNWSPIPVVGS